MKLNCKLLALALIAAASIQMRAQSIYTPYAFKNFVGDPGVAGSADGSGTNAQFHLPFQVAVDSAGNIYVADLVNDTIRKVTPAGVVTTLAGSPGVAGSADGTGASAQFNNPISVAVDNASNVYVADYGNYTIRMIDTSSNVTTLAGSPGNAGYADGIGSAASFDRPASVAVDNAGNLYVADSFNNTIRKIEINNANVTTLAGQPGNAGYADGPGAEALFNQPWGVGVDSGGNVYVGDTVNNMIRKIDTSTNVTTLAGSPGVAGSADGTGTNALFYYPYQVAVDSAGNVYVADTDNSTIRRITPAGVVTTLGGSPGVLGSADGVGSAARFSSPTGVAVDSAGNLYVGDLSNDRISKGIVVLSPLLVSATRSYLDATTVNVVFSEPLLAATATNLSNYALDNGGTISGATLNADEMTVVLTTSPLYNDVTHTLTVNNVEGTNGAPILPGSQITITMPATTGSTSIYEPYAFSNFVGDPGVAGSADGAGTNALFDLPFQVAVDSAGNIYVADFLNDTIRKVTPAGVVTTLAGQPGNPGSGDGNGSGAQFDNPISVAVDNASNVYVADYGNYTIRMIDTSSNVTTLAGSPGNAGYADGIGSAASFDRPASVAVDNAGNLYVADSFNNTIRKIEINNANVTTLAGQPGNAGYADGPGAEALFNQPWGVGVDSGGNVYVGDTVNNMIRKIDTSTNVTTLAGSPGVAGSADGTGTNALFYYPYQVAVDSAGNVYVADTDNSTIRRITPAGVVTTLGGSPGVLGSADGVGSAARFSSPTGVAVDSAGNLYVGDLSNDRISKGTMAPLTVVSAARDYLYATRVSVVFSEAVVAPTATNLSNYALDNGDTISGATLNLDGSVTLTTSPLYNGVTHTLTVNNMQGANGATGSGLQVTISVPGDAIRAEYNVGGTNDVVSLEAEDYNLNTPGGGSSWVFTTDPPLASPSDANTNFSGTGVMWASPVIGRNLGSPALGSAVADSPCLSFTVLFTNTGTFTAWVRGLGDSTPGPGVSDSVFVGLDNALTTGITGFPLGQGYCWGNASVGNSGPMVVITPGFHLINVWMRADGFTVDKILLADNAAFTPANLGPAESAVWGVDITQSGTNLILSWPGGTLQSSTNVAGPYVDVPGAASPYPVAPVGTQNFYRLRRQ
jgi:hypothetical protein